MSIDLTNVLIFPVVFSYDSGKRFESSYNLMYIYSGIYFVDEAKAESSKRSISCLGQHRVAESFRQDHHSSCFLNNEVYLNIQITGSSVFGIDVPIDRYLPALEIVFTMFFKDLWGES